tara:strand:- start:344 stop:499 length:156 start_codon:yes stop_codon:yes gene_type:complete
MKDKILTVLEKFARFEVNLDSEHARELVARELTAVIEDHIKHGDEMPSQEM